MNNNIDDLIESKIDSIVNEKNIYHVGKVVRINEFVVEATGLDDAFFFEKVFIGDQDNIGYVDKIEENKVIIALVKTNGNIKIGDLIKTSGEALEASFSKNAMGMVIDAFGTDRMSGKNFNDSKMIQIETPNIPIMHRTAVNRPLETGIAGIDMMFPIGRGQRQLIIGDKKTGKTQILLDTIVNQKNKNVICIYVSIGKTKKEVKRLYTKLIEKGANAYTMIVAAFNDDTSPMIKLTPYVGISIAQEYMMEGYDVLVCIDDLKKHADACREIALISEKNTGREAYPADIFYTHSRLLEKGCQHMNGGSITVLPVVETKGGDITDYISTNVISITDGQIVLNAKSFKKGQKPAIDFGLSVSRLGSAVQREGIKKLGARVRQELLSYLETADVYQLVKVDSMSKELQEKIIFGKKILSLLNQPKFSPRSEEKMVESFSFVLGDNKEKIALHKEVQVSNDVVKVPEPNRINGSAEKFFMQPDGAKETVDVKEETVKSEDKEVSSIVTEDVKQEVPTTDNVQEVGGFELADVEQVIVDKKEENNEVIELPIQIKETSENSDDNKQTDYVTEPVIVASKEIEELSYDEDDVAKDKEELLQMTRKIPVKEIEMLTENTQEIPVKEIEILTESAEDEVKSNGENRNKSKPRKKKNTNVKSDVPRFIIVEEVE